MMKPSSPDNLIALPARSEHEDLERVRAWLRRIAEVCEEAARGNLEARLIGCEEGGDVARIAKSINHLLDVTDAFVRESRASLDHASEGKYFRRVVVRGLPGTFRQGAAAINAASERMGQQAALEKERLDLASRFAGKIYEVVSNVASAATEMQATAGVLVDNAKFTWTRAAAVAASAGETAANVQAVASATEELGATASEISRQVGDSTLTSQQAVSELERTQVVVGELTQASRKIGNVVNVISDVANQTKLLALNATIEAARVGELGKGFGVVAAEVKNLARQTSGATEDVGQLISTLQGATEHGASALNRVGSAIHRFDTIASTISVSVGEQRSANEEISRNIHQAAIGTRGVSESIALVTTAAQETSDAALAMQTTAGDLSKQAEALSAATREFVAQMKG